MFLFTGLSSKITESYYATIYSAYTPDA